MAEIIFPAIMAMIASHQDIPIAINELPVRYDDIFMLTKSPRGGETYG